MLSNDNNSDFVFTSESITEGHPDKMADTISDSILDAILSEDPVARVACETLVTTGLAHDRQWQIVDAEGGCVTQRNHQAFPCRYADRSACTSPKAHHLYSWDRYRHRRRQPSGWHRRRRDTARRQAPPVWNGRHTFA